MNSQTARERIFYRLHASGTRQTQVPTVAPVPALIPDLSPDEKVGRLTELMTAIRTEIHVVDKDAWQEKFRQLAQDRGWKRILYGPQGPLGPEMESMWPADATDAPQRVTYTQPVETFKEDLFDTIDVGITSTRCGLADIGAVVLWPTVAEPRLLSLVPPVHVAILDADKIYSSMSEMMTAQKWSDGMPTNALIISGPSKTADIEFTLVFGVHGPKELVVLIRK